METPPIRIATEVLERQTKPHPTSPHYDSLRSTSNPNVALSQRPMETVPFLTQSVTAATSGIPTPIAFTTTSQRATPKTSVGNLPDSAIPTSSTACITRNGPATDRVNSANASKNPALTVPKSSAELLVWRSKAGKFGWVCATPRQLPSLRHPSKLLNSCSPEEIPLCFEGCAPEEFFLASARFLLQREALSVL